MTDIKDQLVIQSQKRMELMKLTINSAVKRIHGALSAKVTIYSNVSVFTAPIHIYDGKLQVGIL